MTKRKLVIASRESPLALAQTEYIKTLLTQIHPHLAIEILGITTQADKRLDIPLIEIGGKGLFVKELEEALMDERADMAVHSVKDMPMDLPSGLIMPVISKREDPRDAFVSNLYESLLHLPSNASLGTSSLRRQTQIHALRSDITLRNLRGNINTRLNKLDKGEFDAIVLAGAGLKRLNMSARIRSYIPIEQSLPAAGQGALGIECRENDENLIELIKPLNDELTEYCVTAERALCRRLGGGCKLPVGAFAEIHHGVLLLRGLVADHQGRSIIRAKLQGKPKEALKIGKRVAEELLERGAEKILKEFE